MQAVEFESTTHDGVVSIPPEYQDWNGKPVKVILLELPRTAESGQPISPVKFDAISIQTSNYHFDRNEANERDVVF